MIPSVGDDLYPVNCANDFMLNDFIKDLYFLGGMIYTTSKENRFIILGGII